MLNKYELPADAEIVSAFGGFNFGDGSKDDAAKKAELCGFILDMASGFSCGSSACEVMVRLKLARYTHGFTHPITMTARGRRCIKAAYRHLVGRCERERDGVLVGLNERAERADAEAERLRRLLTDALPYVSDGGGPDCGLTADICDALLPNPGDQARP